MIEVKNVTKKYGSFLAVDDISFTVKDGEVVGFLGPNGAGKSTTMNMITGFIEPSEGTIEVNGFDVQKKGAKARKQIGYMPEGVPLYSELTVKEFVTYMAELKKVSRKEKKQEVEKVLEETGLVDVQKKLIRNLSRGYKQRVSLAGALVGNPSVIILDEPTVGLDPKQITDIRKLIKDLGKKHTVILSSHILSEVSQICERVIIINKGKIVAVDTPENLEKKTQSKNVLLVTVEDPENNMTKLQSEIKEIISCKVVKDNEDGTKQYMIESNENDDIRKKIFEVLPKKNITIFELKKAETSLEDAFITLIENNTQERKNKEEKASENNNNKEKNDKKASEKSNNEEKNKVKTSEKNNEGKEKINNKTEEKKENIKDNKNKEENKKSEKTNNKTNKENKSKTNKKNNRNGGKK